MNLAYDENPDDSASAGVLKQSLSSSAIGFTDQIYEFLESHQNDDFAEAYANVIIDEVSDPEVWGGTNIASQNLFDGYDGLKDYLDAETDEQVSEIQNGIEILETSTLASQGPPQGATIFGGSNTNPLGGPDLESDTDRDYGIFDVINYPAVLAPVAQQKSRMNMLLQGATGLSGLQGVAKDYMTKFENNPAVFNYYNHSLSFAVKGSLNMRNWLKTYGKFLNDQLKLHDGDINGVTPPEQIVRPALNENWGFTILINDTQKVNVYIMDYTYELDNNIGKWEADFIINVVDHFGLDDEDAVDAQYYPGFVSWWALQYRRGWHPFKTDIWFKARLSGNINN